MVRQKRMTGFIIFLLYRAEHTCMVGATLAALMNLLLPGVVLVCVASGDWEDVQE